MKNTNYPLGKAKNRKYPESLVEKIKRCLETRERGKKLYARADSILEEISKEIEPGQVISLNSKGKTAVLVDRFAAGKTVVFQPVGCRRYELKVVDA